MEQTTENQTAQSAPVKTIDVLDHVEKLEASSAAKDSEINSLKLKIEELDITVALLNTRLNTQNVKAKAEALAISTETTPKYWLNRLMSRDTAIGRSRRTFVQGILSLYAVAAGLIALPDVQAVLPLITSFIPSSWLIASPTLIAAVVAIGTYIYNLLEDKPQSI